MQMAWAYYKIVWMHRDAAYAKRINGECAAALPSMAVRAEPPTSAASRALLLASLCCAVIIKFDTINRRIRLGAEDTGAGLSSVCVCVCDV